MGSGGSLRDWKKSLFSVFKSKVIAIFDFPSRASEHSKFTFLLKLLSDVKGSHSTNTRNRKVTRPSRSSQPRSQEIFDRHTFPKTLFSNQRTHFQAITRCQRSKTSSKRRLIPYGCISEGQDIHVTAGSQSCKLKLKTHASRF